MLSQKTNLFLKKLRRQDAGRFRLSPGNPVYLDLRGSDPKNLSRAEVYELSKAARITRGLIFAMLEQRRSGHPGGSSAKVEQFLATTLKSGMKFDLFKPKHPGRDRVVWSAGHCTPLIYSGLSLFYETWRRRGRKISSAVSGAVFPEDLLNFRHTDGLPGHAESSYPLVDFSTGPSGHGLSAAGGLAILHKSVGLKTKIMVFMGDAESQEGMTYEARNLLSAVGADNLIVSLDYNGFGLDGPVNEVLSQNYANYWLGLGWNVIEADGHDFCELILAYEVAQNGWGNKMPTVVIARTQKGYGYGRLANTYHSHGQILATKDYVKAMKELGFSAAGGDRVAEDIKEVMSSLDKECQEYLAANLGSAAAGLLPEKTLVDQMKKGAGRRIFKSPTQVSAPKKLPSRWQFKSGTKVSMRTVAGEWLKWLMEQSAFFYAGAGDLSSSVGTADAEKVYGLINKKNPRGRGIRFGIAEQNMAMMMAALSQDILPGGYQPAAVFGTYGVFGNILANMVRLALFDSHVRKNKGFFIFLATHHGPETGEDGPTHQGTFYNTLYRAFPGIKVYTPLDANELIAMLFSALEIGEPIVLSLPREKSEVFSRRGRGSARDTLQGAYIFKDYDKNRKPKKVLVVSGVKMMENVLAAATDLAQDFNIKIVAVSSPELFAELAQKNPAQAKRVLSDQEKTQALVFTNSSPEFLADILLPYASGSHIFGVEQFLSSGTADEVYEKAGFSAAQIKEKIIK